MQGFHPQKHKTQPKNYANGGIVKGPGTGTSDDVPAMVPKDGYVMPADSVQAMGFKPGMRAAQLSAGEAVLNPQQVQAAGGFQALDAMKAATHTPVPEQGAEGPKFFFANGGMTDDERRKALAQIPNSAPAGWTGGQGERVTGNDFTRNVSNTVNALAPVSGMAAPIVAGVARGVGFGAKAAAASPLLDKVASYGVPAAGFGALASAANQDNEPAASPVTTPTPQITPAAATSVTPSGVPEKPGTPAAQTNMQATAPKPQAQGFTPGVYQHGRGQYSDNPEGMGFKPGFTGQPSAQNMAAADNLAQRSSARGFTPQAQDPQPQGNGVFVGADTGGFGLLDKNRTEQRNLMMDVQQGKPGAKLALQGFLQQQADAPGQQIERDRLAQSATESSADRGFKSQELAARMGDSAADRGLKAQELADNSATNSIKRDAAGVELATAKQLQKLQSDYINAKTPEVQAAAAKKIQALSGKQDKDNRFTVVPGGQEFDAAAGVMRNVPARVLNNQTGQFVDGGQGGQVQLPPGMTKQVGTSNGKPVYEDATGKRFIGG